MAFLNNRLFTKKSLLLRPQTPSAKLLVSLVDNDNRRLRNFFRASESFLSRVKGEEKSRREAFLEAHLILLMESLWARLRTDLLNDSISFRTATLIKDESIDGAYNIELIYPYKILHKKDILSNNLEWTELYIKPLRDDRHLARTVNNYFISPTTFDSTKDEAFDQLFHILYLVNGKRDSPLYNDVPSHLFFKYLMFHERAHAKLYKHWKYFFFIVDVFLSKYYPKYMGEAGLDTVYAFRAVWDEAYAYIPSILNAPEVAARRFSTYLKTTESLDNPHFSALWMLVKLMDGEHYLNHNEVSFWQAFFSERRNSLIPYHDDNGGKLFRDLSQYLCESLSCFSYIASYARFLKDYDDKALSELSVLMSEHFGDIYEALNLSPGDGTIALKELANGFWEEVFSLFPRSEAV